MEIEFFWNIFSLERLFALRNFVCRSLKEKKCEPLEIAARFKASSVFALSDAGIVDSNPTQGIDVWCAYAFILCFCCPAFR
jgi:hypothetical protein